MLGDVAMGNKERLQGISLAYSQIMATGRLMGQDLLQLINQGFNPLQVISEQTGLSIGDLKEKMEKGAISAEMVEEAFRLATSEGGRYYQMTDKMGETAGGKWTQMMGTFEEVTKKIGLRFAEWISPLFDIGKSFAENIIPFGNWVIGFLPSMDNLKIILTLVSGIAFALGLNFLALNGASIALSMGMGILNGVMWVTNGLFSVFNFILNMSPLGKIILLITLLATAAVWAYNKFDQFRATILGLWEVLKGFGTMIKNYVINRFQELLKGIAGVGEALVAFFNGDFEGAMKKGAQAGKNLLGVNSAKQAYQDGKKAISQFDRGWKEGMNKVVPKTAKNIANAPKKVQGEQPKSDIFNSLLNDTGDKKKKKGKKKNPAKDKANGITAGGSRQTNIVVNIGKLQDQTVIQVDNTEKGLNNLSEKVQELLLRAVNSVNQMQSSR